MGKKIKITDFKQDDKNFNKHTKDGLALLNKSIDKVGVIEAFTVSSDDVVISGNARQKTVKEKFKGVEPILIETDGTRPVILKRTDIASGTKEFHEAALLGNTVAAKNLNLDRNLIEDVLVFDFGVDVEELGVEELDPDTGINTNTAPMLPPPLKPAKYGNDDDEENDTPKLIRDYSKVNQEIDFESFESTSELKLVFQHEDYLSILKFFRTIAETPEDAILQIKTEYESRV